MGGDGWGKSADIYFNMRDNDLNKNRIQQLEEQNKEMLEQLILNYKCKSILLNCSECRHYNGCNVPCENINYNKELLEKITGKPIEEVIK